jgi:hypothetical protein
MSDGGDIEVENTVLSDVLPKDVVKEVGNVKLFNKWDYDVEVRDISLTYVRLLWDPESRLSMRLLLEMMGIVLLTEPLEQ